MRKPILMIYLDFFTGIRIALLDKKQQLEQHHMKTNILVATTFALSFSLTGCVIHVGGEHDFDWDDGISSVFGDVSVAPHRKVGEVASVNGDIELMEHVSAESVHSVNGDVEIADDVTVSGINLVNGEIMAGERLTVRNHIELVNGEVSIDEGSTIDGNIETVNGDINLNGVNVGNDLVTNNGDVTLKDNSIIGGNIIFEKQRDSRHVPTLRIEQGSKVQGEIVLYRKVTLKFDDPVLQDKVTYRY